MSINRFCRFLSPQTALENEMVYNQASLELVIFLKYKNFIFSPKFFFVKSTPGAIPAS